MYMYNPQTIVKTLYWLVFGNAAQRRRIPQGFARISASMFGDYPISEDCKLWRED